MRRFLFASLAIASLVPSASSAALRGSLGATLGLAIHDPAEDGLETVTLFGIPNQASITSSLRPGLRIGFAGTKLDHEGYADVSFDLQSSGGDHIHSGRWGVNYQYNFRPDHKTRPYVTAGLGFFTWGVNVDDVPLQASSLTYGGGIGVGLRVSDGFGRLRAEGRLDRIREGTDAEVVLIDEATVYQINLGFDLWMR